MRGAENEFEPWEKTFLGPTAGENGLKIFTLNQEDWLPASE
jgi:hypothetical protein